MYANIKWEMGKKKGEIAASCVCLALHRIKRCPPKSMLQKMEKAAAVFLLLQLVT